MQKNPASFHLCFSLSATAQSIANCAVTIAPGNGVDLSRSAIGSAPPFPGRIQRAGHQPSMSERMNWPCGPTAGGYVSIFSHFLGQQRGLTPGRHQVFDANRQIPQIMLGAAGPKVRAE